MFFGIVHRRIAADRPRVDAPPATAPSWRTCLREVMFFEDASSIAEPIEGERSAGADAYAFLLETICGLRSPMLGETQVLGQFRTFLASLPPADASWLAPLGQQLITDARAIRERHLRGLGSRSYGSAVRRHIRGCDAVGLIGAGSLAAELLPYLAGRARVDQWLRQDIARAAMREILPGRAALVVAAPVRARAIGQVARRYRELARVIDLRGADERDALVLDAPVVTLDDLFSSVSTAAAASASRIDPAIREISRMASAFDHRQQLRPFGWDDLCA